MKTQTIRVVLGCLVLLSIVVPQPTFAAEKLFYFFNNTYGFDYFKKNAKEIDVIAPQVYTVGYDLKVKKPTSAQTKILKEAKRKKVATVPLIVNAEFNKVLMSDILLNQDAQDDIIDFMLDEAEKYDLKGWQFDFENINHLDRDMYTAFVAKTYKVMQENDLEFSVAVIPRSKPYDPLSTDQDWSSAYDFKKLAENSDFLSIMSYDDPYSVGPVASLPYTEKILKYMLTQVPASKMSLGIPLYCWKWDNSINMKVGSTTHKLANDAYKKGKDRDREYHKSLGAEALTYTDKKFKTEYTIWCESEESIKAKMELIEDKGLRGFSAWAIGQEPTWFWTLMKKY